MSDTFSISREWREYITSKFDELCNSKGMTFADLKPSLVPENAGVYVIYKTGDSAMDPLYIGRTKNLRQRLYNNHLMGPLNNARLKNYLIKFGIVKNKDAAKKYIQDNCRVKWIFEDDYRKRGALEGYFTGMMFPTYIDEEH
ncbi:MAG: GIY-YIG nuclease family protein [Spirochaetales bacterium]|nr:GIY-YIG nuclease family protein [Spirochaetales bacterium]